MENNLMFITMDGKKLINFFFSLYFVTNNNEIFRKINDLFTEKGFFKIYPSGLNGYKMLRNIAKCMANNYILKNRVSKIFTLNNFLINDLKYLFVKNKLIEAMEKAEEKAKEFSILEDSKSFNITHLNKGVTKWVTISTQKEKNEINKKIIFFNKILGLDNKEEEQEEQEEEEQKEHKKEHKEKILKIDDSMCYTNDFRHLINSFDKHYVKTNKIKKTLSGCWVCIMRVNKDDRFYNKLKDISMIKIFERINELRFDRTYSFNGIKFNLIESYYFENKNFAKKSIPFIFNKCKINVRYKGKIKDMFKINENKAKEELKLINSLIKS